MNTGVMLEVNRDTTQTFELPRGWTLRRVATALAREWLAPLRPEVVVKPGRWLDRWTVLPIVEEPANGLPLWEKGISTAEYERRLDSPDRAWTVQARAGRPRNTNGMVLVHLSMNPNRPMAFDMVCSQEALPDTMFDPDKLAAFLQAHGHARAEELFACLLIDHGFRDVAGC